jgi:hypothetical protein
MLPVQNGVPVSVQEERMSLLLDDLREELLDRLDGLQLRLQVSVRALRCHYAVRSLQCHQYARSSKQRACHSSAYARLLGSCMQNPEYPQLSGLLPTARMY